MAEDMGQIDGTPPVDTATTGQEKAAASPGSETDQILEALAAGEKAEAGKAALRKPDGEDGKAGKKDGAEGGAEGGDKSKPLPYDQDPKWKAARAAEAKMEAILEKHGLDSIDELDDLIDGGASISEILGVRDAKTLTEKIQQLTKDAEYLKEVKAYWAEQEAQRKRDELTPEERADMSEKQLKEYKDEQAAKARAAEEQLAIKQAISNYTEQVDKTIEAAGFDGEEAKIAKLFLGVDNPFNEVDITDKKAVREMAKNNASRFKTFLDSVRQQAVDDYAKGKSKIVPITPAATPAKETVEKKKLPDSATVEDTFAAARDEMLEIISNM